MLDGEWDEMLAAAAGEVLETMFFTGICGPAEAGAPEAEPRLAAHLSFAGTPGGALTVSLSQPAARSLAANFLAVEADEPLPDSQLGSVVCELANMICGSLLSRVKTEEHFRLSSPELVPAGADCLQRPPSQSFDLGDGRIDLWLVRELHAN